MRRCVLSGVRVCVASLHTELHAGTCIGPNGSSLLSCMTSLLLFKVASRIQSLKQTLTRESEGAQRDDRFAIRHYHSVDMHKREREAFLFSLLCLETTHVMMHGLQLTLLYFSRR